MAGEEQEHGMHDNPLISFQLSNISSFLCYIFFLYMFSISVNCCSVQLSTLTLCKLLTSITPFSNEFHSSLLLFLVLNLASAAFFGEPFILQMENSVSIQISHAPPYFSLLLHFTFFFSYKYQWVENLMNPSYVKKPTSRTPVHASDISIQSNKQPWVPASWVTRIIAYTEDILYLYLWISLLSFSEASSVLLPVLSLRQGV